MVFKNFIFYRHSCAEFTSVWLGYFQQLEAYYKENLEPNLEDEVIIWKA